MAGVELATAYVTIAASAQGLRRSVQQEFNLVQRDAQSTGQNVGRELSRGVSRSLSAGDAIADELSQGGRAADREGQTAGARYTSGVSSRLSGISSTVSGAFSGAGDRAQGEGEATGSSFLDGIKGKIALGAAAVGAAGAAVLAKGFNDALDQQSLNAKLTAQLGLSKGQSKNAGKAAGELFAQGYGDGTEDIGEAIKSVVQNMDGMKGASAKSLKDVSGRALTVSKVFDTDVSESVRGASQLMRTGLAKNSTEAFDIITKGMQNGANKSDDFLDTLNEYGTQFRKLGLSGKDATGLISQGLKAGARDGDLVADSLKEFSIRAVDGSKASVQGFQALGLNATKMSDQIAKGGPAAKKGLNTVLERLRAIKDPAKQSQAAVGLFGTQAEDMGKALYALKPDTAAKGLGKVAGATDKANKAFNDTPSAKIETFKRTLQQGLTNVIANNVIPAVNNFANKLSDMGITTDSVKNSINNVVGFFKKWQGIIVPLAAVVGTLVAGWKIYSAVTRTVAAAQALLNAVMAANPIGLVVIAIAALAVGLILAYKKSETFRNIVNGAFNAVKGVVSGVVGWFKKSFIPFFTTTIPNAFQSVINFVKQHWKLILGLITGPIGAAVILVASNWGKIKGAFSSAWNWVKGVFKKAWGGVKGILTGAINSAKTAINNTLNGVKGLFRAAWNWVSGTFRKSWNGFKNLLSGPITVAKNFIHTRIENIKTNFRNAWTWVSTTFRKSWNGFKTVITAPITAAKKSISTTLDGIKTTFRSFIKGAGKIMSGIKSAMTTPLNSVMSLIEKFAHAIGKIPGLGSLKKIKLPRFAAGGTVPVANGGGHAVLPALANGGTVRGPWRGARADNVLGISNAGMPVARVNPGEYITNVAATRRMQRQHPGVLEHINATGSLPGFAGGGLAGGPAGGKFPTSGFSDRWMWNLVKKHFPAAVLTSAYRPGAQTAGGYGASYHSIGRAIDIGGPAGTRAAVAQWLLSHYGRASHDLIYSGLWGNSSVYEGRPAHVNAATAENHRTHVHWGLRQGGGKGGILGALGGLLGGAKDWLVDKAFSGPKKLFEAAVGKIPGSGLAKMMITGFSGKIVDGIKNFVTGNADGGEAWGSTASSAASIATGKKMAASRGWSGNQWSALYNLWNGESGWNPRAKNKSSGAYGIPQALPGTKMASAGKDWMTNGATQIRWGLDYIKGRYGSPSAAFSKWQARSPHWYSTGTMSASGGINGVAENGAELVLSPSMRKFRGGEQVLNAQRTSQLLSGGDSSAPTFNIYGVSADKTDALAKDVFFELKRRSAGRYAGL